MTLGVFFLERFVKGARRKQSDTKTRSYDHEFNPDALKMLKKREILGRARSANLVPLDYNLSTQAAALEQEFQEERRWNPLLETTPPEAWLCAEILPFIREVRSNVDVDDRLLSEAVQLRVQQHTKKSQSSKDELVTTIEPYIPVVKKLFVDLFDRTKSLRQILGLRRGSYDVREITTTRKPTTKRETIFLRGLGEQWSNRRIAKSLDEEGVKPRSTEYRSFLELA